MNPHPSRFCFIFALAILLTTVVLGMPSSYAALPTSASAEEWRKTNDAVEGYTERLFFFGESTTAHLARRGGIFDTPTDSVRVLRDESGTRMLNRRILSSPVLITNADGTTLKLPFSDALQRLTPEYLVLSFGLNGIMGFIRDPQSFTDAYSILIQGIQKVSPNTRIILQSVYPVRSAQHYSVDVETLNSHIETLNRWIRELAATHQNTRFVDTASVLRDTDGKLLACYDVGDGIHLTNDAYRVILSYLCSHAWL